MSLHIITHHPELVLYLALAATYFSLALQARCERHAIASQLYAASGVLHAGLALCHLLH